MCVQTPGKTLDGTQGNIQNAYNCAFGIKLVAVWRHFKGVFALVANNFWTMLTSSCSPVTPHLRNTLFFWDNRRLMVFKVASRSWYLFGHMPNDLNLVWKCHVTHQFPKGKSWTGTTFQCLPFITFAWFTSKCFFCYPTWKKETDCWYDTKHNEQIQPLKKECTKSMLTNGSVTRTKQRGTTLKKLTDLNLSFASFPTKSPGQFSSDLLYKKPNLSIAS